VFAFLLVLEVAVAIRFRYQSGGSQYQRQAPRQRQSNEEDLYSILGVKQDASHQEIKQAYKSLAKKWHPDKNKEDPNASDVYIKIANAYDILSDVDKRRKYDQYGSVDDNSQGRGGFDNFDAFDFFFGGGGSQRSSKQSNQRTYETPSITAQNFEYYVTQSSDLWLLYFYSEWCSPCREFADAWEESYSSLKGVVKMGRIDAEWERSLSRHFGIRHLPTIVVVSGSLSEHYTGALSKEGLIDYVNSRIEDKTHRVHTRSEWEELIANNPEKVRVLLFTNSKIPSLVLKHSALKFEQNMVFGVTSMESDLAVQYTVINFPTYLLFKEESKPLKFSGSKKDELLQFFEKNQYLIFPKIEFHNFKTLCKSSEKACILYIANEKKDTESMKSIALEYSGKSAEFNKFQFAWISPSEQQKFCSIFTNSSARMIVAINFKNARWYFSIYQGNSDFVEKTGIQQWASDLIRGNIQLKKTNVELETLLENYQTFFQKFTGLFSRGKDGIVFFWKYGLSSTREVLIALALITYSLFLCFGGKNQDQPTSPNSKDDWPSLTTPEFTAMMSKKEGGYIILKYQQSPLKVEELQKQLQRIPESYKHDKVFFHSTTLALASKFIPKLELDTIYLIAVNAKQSKVCLFSLPSGSFAIEKVKDWVDKLVRGQLVFESIQETPQ